AKERVETLNKADSLIFQTEKQLKEFGDKIPADKKQPIEDALGELKKAHEAQDVDAIEPAIEKLNTVFQAASQEMYSAGQDGQGGAEASAEGDASGDEEVTDVDFEEVNDEKK
ncbi:MAG: Hsp70 family protein, partial [Flavobacteriales bacterium]|nr:Hsp70 family protein [Flavobacteriales bacterium]